MPLPNPNTPWPPRDIAPALERMRTWDAWWAGDTDELERVYGRSRPGPHAGEVRPAQLAGGVVGAAARFWWGRPPAQGEPGTKLHVPLAGDVCRASADLLFSEPLTVYADNDATTDALDEFLGDDTTARFLEGAETCAGLGGVYLRIAHNADAFDDAWVDSIAPDAAYPEWIGGRLVAVTLWWVLDNDRDRDVVWRHLERHDKGVVTHGVYRGTADNLGRVMPLAEHPATAPLAAHVNEDGGIPTGYDDGLDVVYVPNMRPQRRWRRSNVLGPFGRSDLDGIEGMFDALDEVYSSWLRDIRLAKGRIIVPETYLETGGPGRGAMFDPDREVYSTLPGILDKGTGGTLTVQQFAIRVEEHDRTAQAIIAQALRTAGYSAQTFGEADTSAATATEVVARERRSYITRARKVQYVRPQVIELLTAWLAIRAHALGRDELDPTGLTIAFPDAVSEDLATLASTASTLSAARAASTETRVRLVNPDADDVWVQAEVARIRDEEDGAHSVVDLDGYRPDPTTYATADGTAGDTDPGTGDGADEGPPNGDPVDTAAGSGSRV